jgi:hypothetical protein
MRAAAERWTFSPGSAGSPQQRRVGVMASDPIETAPKNEEWIVLLDESGHDFEVGRWSAKRGTWVGRDGAPIRIKPASWFRPNSSWLSTDYASAQDETAPRRKRFGLYTALLIIAWLAIMEVPWFGEHFTREKLVKIFSAENWVTPQESH